jgi:hypothetical protein
MTFVAMDFETGGRDPGRHPLMEVAAVPFLGGQRIGPCFRVGVLPFAGQRAREVAGWDWWGSDGLGEEQAARARGRWADRTKAMLGITPARALPAVAAGTGLRALALRAGLAYEADLAAGHHDPEFDAVLAGRLWCWLLKRLRAAGTAAATTYGVPEGSRLIGV